MLHVIYSVFNIGKLFKDRVTLNLKLLCFLQFFDKFGGLEIPCNRKLTLANLDIWCRQGSQNFIKAAVLEQVDKQG